MVPHGCPINLPALRGIARPRFSSLASTWTIHTTSVQPREDESTGRREGEDCSMML